jgi:hypothetical protein
MNKQLHINYVINKIVNADVHQITLREKAYV